MIAGLQVSQSEAIQIFGPIFRQNYGMAEAMMPLICLHPQDHVTQGKDVNLKRLSSVGRPALGVEVRVVDKKRREIEPGEIGEIIIRSENMMKGYWKNKKETAKILKNGWLHTGDLATVDDEGYVYMMDRKKDMIVVSGYKVWPRDVEDVIYQHPAVKETAVVGLPDSYRGETVKAFVALKEGMENSVTPEEIISFCKARMAAYKYPRQVEIVSEIPKTLTGKFLRRSLREKEKSEDKN